MPPKDGESFPLDEVADITVGFVGPMKSEYVEEGIPFLRSQNVKPFRIDLADVKYINDSFHNRLSKSSLRPGDVVVVRTGTPGTAAVIPATLPIANCSDLVVIRPHGNLDPWYLSYFINGAAKGFVSSRLVGAVQQHFNVGSARELKLPNLQLAEQQAIASVLRPLDAKAEANRRTVSILSELLSATWTESFETAESLEWPIYPIGEVASVVGGSTPKTAIRDFWGGTISWATPKDLSRLPSAPLLGTERRITELGLRQISSGLLPKGTVLLSSRAPIGYLAIAEVPVAINQGFIAIIAKERLSNLYLWQWMQAHMEEIKSRANGTTFLEVSKASFRPVLISIPPSGAMQSWTNWAAPQYRLIVEREKESRILARSRDALLPKLLSGELRVREAKSLVEDAV
ncbi:MAG TPA: restriction endonuclease subunit S [Candidatus Dormibacteraeota bacterium]|nr:restriction endonuclease subunit S [Candidatus Dormibacteraeota bacterium]